MSGVFARFCGLGVGVLGSGVLGDGTLAGLTPKDARRDRRGINPQLLFSIPELGVELPVVVSLDVVQVEIMMTSEELLLLASPSNR